MKLAVCVVVYNKEGQLLMVSRKNRPGDWNLPGGKVEEGELPNAAALRELVEETGLLGSKTKYVFSSAIEDYCVDCYVVREYTGTIAQIEGEGEVRWGSWDDLLQPERAFFEYNTKLYEHLVKLDLVNVK